MIDITKYTEEVQRLIDNFDGNKDKLKDVLNNISVAILEKQYGKVERANMASEALSMIFRNAYGQDPVIPISFLETEVGKAIMRCKYQVPIIYTVKEVAEFMGCTVQQVYYDKKRLIKPIDEDLNFFYEDEVVRYLEKKGIPLENMYK